MARLLSQLLCGACGHRFWPERSDAHELLVRCPRCHAPHANPGAQRRDPSRVWLPEDASRWADRHWVGPVPQVLRAVSPVLVEQVIDGFPSCFLHFQRGELERDGKTYGFTPHVLILICAQRPPHPASITVDAIAARWMPGGLAVLVPTGGSGAAYLSSRVWPALVAQARAQGAVPILPVHEVADPTPLDPAQHARELAVHADAMADARLESRDVRCAHCGAPSRVTELVGDARCPYCATPQSLPHELVLELQAYQARVHAAQLRARQSVASGFMTGHLRELPAKHIAQMCVHCGAPNVHRIGALDETCASCRAPMVPRRTVMMQGLAAVQVGADRARRAGEAAWAQRTVATEGARHFLWTVAVSVGCVAAFVYYLAAMLPALSAGGELLPQLSSSLRCSCRPRWRAWRLLWWRGTTVAARCGACAGVPSQSSSARRASRRRTR